MKKIIALVLSFVLVLSLGLMVGCGSKGDNGEVKGDETDKSGVIEIDPSEMVTLVLIDKDKQEYTYELHAKEGTSLKDALYEDGLIDEDTYYAMFVETIDGHTADVLNDGCTWRPLDEDGNQIMGTFDTIELHPGQKITLEYYKVPDMD